MSSVTPLSTHPLPSSQTATSKPKVRPDCSSGELSSRIQTFYSRRLPPAFRAKQKPSRSDPFVRFWPWWFIPLPFLSCSAQALAVPNQIQCGVSDGKLALLRRWPSCTNACCAICGEKICSRSAHLRHHTSLALLGVERSR